VGAGLVAGAAAGYYGCTDPYYGGYNNYNCNHTYPSYSTTGYNPYAGYRYRTY
jgi:hypothetical protein